MNVPRLGGTWSCIAGSGPCLSSQKLPYAPETSTGAGSAWILVPGRAPESWLCLCQLWDPGPGTHPRSHLSPCKWRQGQYHPPRTAALTAYRSQGLQLKPCLTQRHSGYINESELSHPYLEIWDSGVIFMLHKFIPKRKRFKKKNSLYKITIIFLKFYFESTQRKAPHLTTLSCSFIFKNLL